jgi:hypothetical protein
MSQRCHEETFALASSHPPFRSRLGLRAKFAISASVDAAPAVVETAQSSPDMFVARLSLCTQTDTLEKL